MKIKLAYTKVIIVLIFLNTSCGASKNKYSTETLDKLHQLIENKDFTINSNKAYPQASNALNSLSNAGIFSPGDNAGQISLIGNSNFIKIKGDSITASLPYYGERQIGGGYNTASTGIELAGLIREYQVDFNDKKKRYKLSLKAKESTESYNITINIFPNKETYVYINSSHRNNIAYRGNVDATE